ncbi:MAG: SusC/RagA family TonB-linked outer membrane protein [Prevotella sp.]|nr:SusC/RagA family TonB-linked outer membrane protein [Prevotella sp.]
MDKRRWTTLLLLLCLTVFPALAQSGGITISCQNEPLQKALRRLEKVSKQKIMFTYEDVENYSVTGEVKDVPFEAALQMMLVGKPFEYKVDGNLVTINRVQQQQSGNREIMGIVVDETGEPLIGATVTNVKSGGNRETFTTITDVNGHFKLTLSGDVTQLEVNYIGFQSKVVYLNADSNYRIQLMPDSKAINEVVVTGVFERKANTYTGAVTTVKGEELQRVGNVNVLQSLKNIDPSFMQIENLAAGSNPNALPDFQMRGSSTISSVQGEYASSANQPLFILDGFETELTKILDLDMNQVESVTTLKDATAKAIYGSKAANGVIVIETKRPESGKMRITYTGSISLEVPDLTSYDLTNAKEKLDVERMAGLFSSENAKSQIALDELYTQKLRELLAGVDTDWLAQPVRNGFGHKHSLYIEGGDKSMQYGVNLAYNKIGGAMKGSDRNTFSGGVTLAYRVKNLQFRDKLTIDHNKSTNSPYGTFDQYYRMNPYSRLYDTNGQLIRNYDYMNSAGESKAYYNPLYNTTLNTFDRTGYTTITNDFYLEWFINEEFKLTGRFGIIDKHSTADNFKPANHTDFIDQTDEFRKGSYFQSNGKNTDISADLGLQWSKQMNDHLMFINGQLSMSDNKYNTTGITAEGFPNDFMDDIKFGVMYAKDSKPTGSEGISRNCGGLLSLNYSFAERYLFDANYRLMGSSEAGKDNRWGSFWSVGADWNIHNEPFMKNVKWVNRLKLRGSYGYTGSQGFSSYDAMPTFVYFSNRAHTYYTFNPSTSRYEEATTIGSYLQGLANEMLHWQEKYDTNFGLDIALFNNRLSGRFDYYIANTKGMVTNVTVPTSTGFSTYVANLGETENKGIEAYLNYRVFDGGRNYVNVFASAAHNVNKLKKISNSLRAWNDAQDANTLENKLTAPQVKYYEGCSMNAIWAVPSLGIDPQTGKEIFLKKDGSVTYEYDVNDQVVCGDTQPKWNGNFGVNGEINGWGWNITMNYRWGGQIYNQTLVDKVENAPMEYNVDRRVFTDRWQKPGDRSLYKAITDLTTTYPTSRFVQDYSLFTLSSLTIYYDFRNCKFVKNSFLERLKVSAYTNDLFVISSVKTERGTSYPFARTFSLSAQLTF